MPELTLTVRFDDDERDLLARAYNLYDSDITSPAILDLLGGAKDNEEVSPDLWRNVPARMLVSLHEFTDDDARSTIREAVALIAGVAARIGGYRVPDISPFVLQKMLEGMHAHDAVVVDDGEVWLPIIGRPGWIPLNGNETTRHPMWSDSPVLVLPSPEAGGE